MRAKRIVIVANTTWNIYNFRLNVIRKLLNEGHEVIVMADKEINKVVEQKQWDNMVAGLIQNIRQGKVVDGIELAIKQCGDLLLEKGFVITADDINELGDELRINGSNE